MIILRVNSYNKSNYIFPQKAKWFATMVTIHGLWNWSKSHRTRETIQMWLQSDVKRLSHIKEILDIPRDPVLLISSTWVSNEPTNNTTKNPKPDSERFQNGSWQISKNHLGRILERYQANYLQEIVRPILTPEISNGYRIENLQDISRIAASVPSKPLTWAWSRGRIRI